MTAMNLLEYAKLEQDPIRRGIIELYPQSSPLLDLLPFMNIQGNAYRYNMEDTLPGVAFRGINEGYTPSPGIINNAVESLVIAGGELDVDRFLIQTAGAGMRSLHEAMKMKALALSMTKAILRGDSSTDPRTIDGLKRRITGSQLIQNGTTTDGGVALSLAALDELIDAVDNPSCLIMNKTLKRRIAVAARNYTISGQLTVSSDNFGRRVTSYNDIPIVVLDKDETGSQLLPFTEASAHGDDSASTSVYCLSFGDDGVVGIQSSPPQVTDLGELQSAPVFRTRVEWYMGLCIFRATAAARLYGIKDAAVTA